MRTLEAHGLAVAALLGLAVFILQPIQGDMAFWSPAEGSLLIAASISIAAGCFAWWRFGSRKALIVGDVLALVPMALESLRLIWLPVTLVAAALLLMGVASVRSHDATAGGSARRMATAHKVALVAALTIWALFAWFAAETVLGGPAPSFNYGVTEVVVAGVIGFAILFWLDARPGVLLGGSLALLYFSVRRLTSVDEITRAHPEVLVPSIVLLVASAIVVVATARSLWRRPRPGQLASLAVAAITVATLVTQQLASPVALVAALVIERSSPEPDPVPPAGELATA
jgi:hypothetical protein